MKKVKITDYGSFEYGKHNNGGAYSYSTIYKKLDCGLWEVSYSTSASADFEFCPCCGSFGCNVCDPHRDGDYELVNTNKVMWEIEKARMTEDMEVKIC